MTKQHKTKSILRWSSIIFLCVAFIGYGIFEARKIIRGPQINLVYPENGSTITDSLVTISGTTQNIKSLTLNDHTIYMDEKGQWKEKLMLPQGYTILTLAGTDRFGKTVEQQVQFIHNSETKS